MSGSQARTGGCGCGAVRYAFTGEIVAALNCHCRDCQHASGSAFASMLIVWESAFRFTRGEPRFYTKQSDRDTTLNRGFCGDCGSPLVILEPHRPKLVFLQAASLDDAGRHEPTMDIFTASAQPWDVMNPALEKHPGMPPIPDELGR